MIIPLDIRKPEFHGCIAETFFGNLQTFTVKPQYGIEVIQVGQRIMQRNLALPHTTHAKYIDRLQPIRRILIIESGFQCRKFSVSTEELGISRAREQRTRQGCLPVRSLDISLLEPFP